MLSLRKPYLKSNSSFFNSSVFIRVVLAHYLALLLYFKVITVQLVTEQSVMTVHKSCTKLQEVHVQGDSSDSTYLFN